ncbi:unnamed protein product [Closterium sp. NIES-53]
MHSRILVSGLPRSVPSLARSPAPPCLPCIDGRQRAAPHSSEFPPTVAPPHTLHMDVWGPAPVGGTNQECYFLLVVDDHTRYTTVFPLRRKADVSGVLIPWIRATRCQLRERFSRDFPSIIQLARTSMIHAAAPHFLWLFAVRYAAHQLNLWPRVSEPETSPTLQWTGKVGDASVFRVWGALSLVCDAKASKLSSCTLHCVFLGFPTDAQPWQFYQPRSRQVFSSQDITFDEFVCYYRLHPHASHPTHPPWLSLWISLLTPLAQPAAVDSGAETAGAEPWGAEIEGEGSGVAATGGASSGGAAKGGAGSWGAATGGADSGGPTSPRGGGAVGDPAGGPGVGQPPQPDLLETLSLQAIRAWIVRRGSPGGGGYGPAGAGAASPGGTAGAGGTGGTAGGAGGAARAGGTRGDASAGGAGATSPRGATGVGGAGPTSLGGTAGAGGAGGVAGAGGAGAGGTVGAGAAGTALRRPFFYRQLQSSLLPPDSVLRQVLSLPSSTGLPLPLMSPPIDQSQPQLLPGSLLPVTAPHTEVTESLTERHEPETRASTPGRARRVARPRPLAVPGTHGMALRPSSVPQCVVLPKPPASSLPHVPDPESGLACAASPTVTRLLATVVTDPDLESTTTFSLVTELVNFASGSRLNYIASLVTESDLSLSVLRPLYPEGDPDALDIPTPRSYIEAIAGEYSSQWQTAMDAEMAFWKCTGTYVDEAPPPGANIVDGMWIFRVKWPPGSPPAFKARYVARGFRQRQGRDYELHSLDFSTAFLQGSLHEEIWLRRPPGFTGSFPAGTQWSLQRPVYSLRQAPQEWHDTLRTTLAALGFSPSSADSSLFLRTDTTLPVRILCFSSLQWVQPFLFSLISLVNSLTLPPFYVLVYVDDLVFATADTKALALVLQRFGFHFSLPHPTPLSIGHSLSAPPSDESVEPSGPYPELVGYLMYLIMCTRPDLAYPLSLLARYVAPGRHRKVHWDAAKRVLRYLCSTSGMGLVLGGQGSVVLTEHFDASWADNQATQRSSQGYTFSLGSGSVSWRSTRSSSMLSSSCEAKIYAGAMSAQELRWLTYLLTDLGEQPRSPQVLYVDNKAMLALCHEQRLEHRMKHISLLYFLARELQQRHQLRLSYVASRANTADVFTKALGSGDHQRFYTALGLVPTLPHLLVA